MRYEDETRKIERDGDRLRFTHKIQNIELSFDPGFCGMVEVAGNSYLQKAAEHLRRQGEKPENWFSIQADGRVILLPRSAQAIILETVKEIKAEREAAVTPAQRERWNIDGMFAEAEKLQDYPGDYFPALNRAKAALDSWRAKHPEAAKEEDRANLISLAEHQEFLADGALTYDADGWLSSTDQEQRAAEFRAKAAELRKRAATL